jgi:hypothetical protein
MTPKSPDDISPRNDGQPTRLCPVDPRTGELVVSPPLEENATKIFPKRPTAPRGSQRRTGEFVPSKGARSTSELTLPWQPGAKETLWQRACSLTVRLIKAVPRRTWAIGLTGSLILIVLSALPAAARSKEPPTNSEPAPPQTKELPNDASPKTSGPPTGVPERPGDPQASNRSLAQAVFAVAEGRYAEALDLYEELHLAAPGDLATSTALGILRQASRGKEQGAP